LVLVVLEGVAASGPVMVGLAESSPGWWQKMAAASRQWSAVEEEVEEEEDGLACLVGLCISLGYK